MANGSIDITKPLSTSVYFTKKDLVEYLQNADIDDSARVTLRFDKKAGNFYLFFYWSEGPGAFGHRAIEFDAESKCPRVMTRLSEPIQDDGEVGEAIRILKNSFYGIH